MLVAILVASYPPAWAGAQVPYALPFQLRPAVAPNLVRLEAVLDAREGGASGVAVVTGACRVLPSLSLLARAAYVVDVSGRAAEGAFANPLLGLLFARDVAPGLRVGVFAASTVPIGQGERLPADSPEVLALSNGRLARASLDNALFSTNHLTVAVGVSAAWLVERFTIQIEATLLGAFRVRASPDSIVENLTCAGWVAYAITDWLFAGVALHHQHFLSTPSAVRSGGELGRAQTSVAVGTRVRIPLGAGVWVAPGLSYLHGIGGLLAVRDDHVLTLDVPTTF